MKTALKLYELLVSIPYTPCLSVTTLLIADLHFHFLELVRDKSKYTTRNSL